MNRVSHTLFACRRYRVARGPAGVLAQQQAPVATFGEIIGLGGTPSDIVLDELRGRLYLVNNHSNKVDIYGIAGEALIGSIPVGLVPLSGDVHGRRVALRHQQQCSRSALSTSDLSVAQTVMLPPSPRALRWAPMAAP